MTKLVYNANLTLAKVFSVKFTKSDNLKKEKTDQSEPDMTTDPRLEPEQKEENLTIPVVAENKRIPIPEPVEEEPKKRGFLSRFFLPNG